MSDIDIECYRGDTQAWTVVVTKDALPVDLTGATLTMTAKRSYAASTTVFTRTTGGQGVVIDADQTVNKGKAVIKLATTSTSLLPADKSTLRYDIQVITAGGDTWTVSAGQLTVKPDVTP